MDIIGAISVLGGFLPDITINDKHVTLIRLLGAMGGIFIGGGAVVAALMYYVNFWRGRDTHSIEMLGVAHEETGKAEDGKLKTYMITAEVWGHASDVHEMLGKFNKPLGDLLVHEISAAPDDMPYVSIQKDRDRRWIFRKLDGSLDGNDWAANAARVKRRPVSRDRFGACLLAPKDPIDGIKTGVGIVFDDACAEEYSHATFVSRCKVADPWMENVPHLLHLAAIAWRKRKVGDHKYVVWTVTMSTRP